MATREGRPREHSPLVDGFQSKARQIGSHDSLLACTQRVNKPCNLCCIAKKSLSSRSRRNFHAPEGAQKTKLTAHFRWLYRRRLFPVRRFLFRYENKHKTLCGSRATRQKTATSLCLLWVEQSSADSGRNLREYFDTFRCAFHVIKLSCTKLPSLNRTL